MFVLETLLRLNHCLGQALCRVQKLVNFIFFSLQTKLFYSTGNVFLKRQAKSLGASNLADSFEFHDLLLEGTPTHGSLISFHKRQLSSLHVHTVARQANKGRVFKVSICQAQSPGRFRRNVLECLVVFNISTSTLGTTNGVKSKVEKGFLKRINSCFS